MKIIESGVLLIFPLNEITCHCRQKEGKQKGRRFEPLHSVEIRMSISKSDPIYFTVHIRQAIDQQKVIEGMDYEQVYLAIGLTWCKSRSYYKGKNTEVWVYQRDLFTGKPTLLDNCNKGSIRIYFEDEKVVGWDNL